MSQDAVEGPTGKVKLFTERLILREVEEDDWSSVHRYWSDPEVGRYMPRRTLDEKGAKDLVQKALLGQQSQPRRYFRLVVTLKDGHRIVGDCVCRVTDQDNREDLARIVGQAYIGYFLDRKFWGHGYATETAKALLAYGFKRLDLNRIWAWCDVENSASVRVLEKIGMKQEAHFRSSVLIQGLWRDCLVYGLLKHEWSPPGTFLDASIEA